MKWYDQKMDEFSLPIMHHCLSGNETYAKASNMFDLQNVVIIVPLLALLKDLLMYDARNSTKKWFILLIDLSNHKIYFLIKRSMEFLVPPFDASTFSQFPLVFSASNTFIDIKVASITPLRDGVPESSQRTY